MAGLTISVKLTAVLLAATILAYAMLALILWLPRRSLVSAVAWRWSMLAVIVSMVIMVAMNPFLYPNPADRLQQMFAFRTQEMFGQAALSENEAVPPGLAVRLPLAAERTLFELATLNKRFNAPLDLPLVALGLATLGYRLIRRRSEQETLGPDGFMLLCCAVTMVGLAWNLGLDWARYYMPLLTLTSILIGVGADSLLRAIRGIARIT